MLSQYASSTRFTTDNEQSALLRFYNVICRHNFARRCSLDRYLRPSLILKTLKSVQCRVLLWTQCLNLTRDSHGSSSPSASAVMNASLHGAIVDTAQFALDLFLDFSTSLPVMKETKRQEKNIVLVKRDT